MLGIALIAIGEMFSEVGISMGKYQFSQKRESLYAVGFLNSIWAILLLGVMAFLRKGEFIFSLESLPTFLLRAVLEIALLFISLNAMLSADRSTFSFLRIITIPLLLVVDLLLGYHIETLHIVGIGVIIATLLFLLLNEKLSSTGKLLSFLSALLAVGTISLYKYNITHFNSVESEQIIMSAINILALIIGARIRLKENVFKTLTNKLFFFQSLASGIATVFISFAYLFAPASIITTGKRSFEILTSIISGRTYFKEKHLGIKLAAFSFIVLGIVLIVL